LACGNVVNKAALRGTKEFSSELGREAQSRRAGGGLELRAAIYHCFDFCWEQWLLGTWQVSVSPLSDFILPLLRWNCCSWRWCCISSLFTLIICHIHMLFILSSA